MSNPGQSDSSGTTNDSNFTVLDVTGLQCPLPVLKAQKSLRSLATGAVLQVISTDPMATIDIPHFCTEHRHKLLRQEPHGDAVHYFIEKR